MNRGNQSFPASFKFQSMWLKHADCKRVLQEAWSRSFVGCPMMIIFQKLKALKADLKEWNRDVFGDVHNRVAIAQSNLDRLQMDLADSGFNEDLYL